MMKISDITTANLDNGQLEYIRNQNRVKFEVVDHPMEPPKKKGSFLGKIFKAIAGFSPLALLAGPIGLPIALSGAGLGSLGAKMDAKASQPDPNAERPAPITYPGLSPVAMAGYEGSSIAPVSFGQDRALDLIAASRDNALYSSAREIGK